MDILSCGAGMQSTALALMSCENAISRKPVHPAVPVYDAVVYCDLGFEPPWVQKQADFIRRSCQSAGIPFKVIDAPLYTDFMRNFGLRRTISIPWWTVRADGHKAKMPRYCTIDYKINAIAKYLRWDLLGYKKGQRLRERDKKTHFMHIGFSVEEKKRCRASTNPLYHNRFPLVEMGYRRSDSYAYILEVWGLETRASACTFCPFHRNHFFQYLKEHVPEQFKQLVEIDNLLRDRTPKPPMDSDLYISRSRARIVDLSPEGCNDAETFEFDTPLG